MTTKYEEQMYNDIHRIANALEKIAEHYQKGSFALSIDGFNKCEMPSQNKEAITCLYCFSSNIKALYGTINLDGSNNRIHYICEDCHKEFDV